MLVSLLAALVAGQAARAPVRDGRDRRPVLALRRRGVDRHLRRRLPDPLGARDHGDPDRGRPLEDHLDRLPRRRPQELPPRGRVRPRRPRPGASSPASRSPPTPRRASRSGTGATRPVWSPFLLLLMAIKFWIVAYFFMHLKFDKPILTRLFYSGLAPRPSRSTWRSPCLMLHGFRGRSALTPMSRRSPPPIPIWRWQPHPEVWLLVGWGHRAAGLRRPGDRPEGRRRRARDAVPHPPDRGVRRGRRACCGSPSDWPLHDIAEERLYSVHMLQHLLLTMVVPPLFWLATPEWLARLVVRDDGRGQAGAVAAGQAGAGARASSTS